MTMIASVLHLDRQAFKVLRITDPYSLHRVVYSLYPDMRDAAAKRGSTASGILYADKGGDCLERRILLLSDRPPADQLPGGHGRVESRPLPDHFLDHDHYRFQVIVNPTRRDNASRKLLPVKGRSEIAQWFQDRSRSNWGFEVIPQTLQVERVEVLRFQDKQDHPVTQAQAHLQGLLTVRDRDQFQASFRQGIGRGRAFGCGLLQIVPVITNPFA